MATARRPGCAMVRAKGFEPPRLSSLEPKSSASTSSATPACVPACVPKSDAGVRAGFLLENKGRSIAGRSRNSKAGNPGFLSHFDGPRQVVRQVFRDEAGSRYSAAQSVQVGAGSCGIERRHALREQAANDPGEHIARAGCRKVRPARSCLQRRCRCGFATTVSAPLSSTTAPALCAAMRAASIRFGDCLSRFGKTRSNSPSWGVRTHRGVSRLDQGFRRVGKRRQCVGVQNDAKQAMRARQRRDPASLGRYRCLGR